MLLGFTIITKTDSTKKPTSERNFKEKNLSTFPIRDLYPEQKKPPRHSLYRKPYRSHFDFSGGWLCGTYRQQFACLCMRGRGRKLVAIQTEAHARCVICALVLFGVAWPTAASNHVQGIATARSGQRQDSIRHFLLSCSRPPLPGRLQQTRSAAVVLGGESTKCLT